MLFQFIFAVDALLRRHYVSSALMPLLRHATIFFAADSPATPLLMPPPRHGHYH